MEDTELKVGGFRFKGVYLAVLLPVLSGLSGAIYVAYDALKRFEAVEEEISTVLEVESRVQTIEQAVQDNGVRQLGPKLESISTQMAAILEQQKTLLDLRSSVERSQLLTEGLDARFLKIETDIEDLWRAVDELNKNPLGR